MPVRAVAEQLEPFEVRVDRELKDGSPVVAVLRAQTSGAKGNAAPYDVDFGKMMVKTASHLLSCGVRALYAYAAGDEISILLGPASELARPRALLVRIVSEATAKLTLLMGTIATFDGQLYEFPSSERAVEYFRAVQEETRQRALDRYCSFILSREQAAKGSSLDGMGEAKKIELLREHEIVFEELPGWQLRGSGVYVRPNGARDSVRLVVDPHLPNAEAYGEYLTRFFATQA